MKKVIMMMAVAMMTACNGKVDNALNNESAASPIDNSNPLRLAVAGVTHGHVGEVASRVGRGDFVVVGVSEENDTYRADNPLSSKVASEVFYKSLTEMLDQTKPEVVAAYGSIKDHLAVVEAAAPRGIDVMVEKPLAATLEDALRIQQLAQQYGIKVVTNYETTWYSTNHYAKQLIDEGKIGEMRRINVQDGHQGPFEINCEPRFTDWLCDPVLNGGGAVMDFGCYGADIVTWLRKGERPQSVYAVLQQNKPDKYPKVDDDATITLQYPGMTAQVMASWCWPWNHKDMTIYGDNGYIYQRTGTRMDTLIGEEFSTDVDVPKLEQPYNDAFRYLKAVVRGDIQMLPYDLGALENNVLVVEILEAAKKSALTGRSIEL